MIGRFELGAMDFYKDVVLVPHEIFQVNLKTAVELLVLLTNILIKYSFLNIKKKNH